MKTVNLGKTAWAVCGIWLVLWLAKRLSGTAFAVLCICTYIAYLVIDSWITSQWDYAKLSYATAGRNERASQQYLAASTEQTRQAKLKLTVALVGLVVVLIKFLPLVLHWFGIN